MSILSDSENTKPAAWNTSSSTGQLPHSIWPFAPTSSHIPSAAALSPCVWANPAAAAPIQVCTTSSRRRQCCTAKSRAETPTFQRGLNFQPGFPPRRWKLPRTWTSSSSSKAEWVCTWLGSLGDGNGRGSSKTPSGWQWIGKLCCRKLRILKINISSIIIYMFETLINFWRRADLISKRIIPN